MYGIKIFDLNIIDVLVAEFRESIVPAIPGLLSLLIHSRSNDRKVGVDALSRFSEQGKMSKFLS